MKFSSKVWTLALVGFAVVVLSAHTSYPVGQTDAAFKPKTQPTDIPADRAFDLVEEMFDQCKRITTLQCVVQKKERYEGKYSEASSFIKMTTSPYRVYLRQLEPKEGVELLYIETENSGKVLVNPNGFPWFNISLDPFGSMIRDKQHHVIKDIGFSKFNAVLAHLLTKYGSDGDALVSHGGQIEINGKKCHIVEINNSHYELVSYTPQAGETTYSISEKFKVSEYRIVELNDAISSFGSVAENEPITIPNDYAPKIRLFIEQELKIPMRFEIYDDNQELFEAYQYDNMVINASFSESEFTTAYPEYGF